MTAEATNLKISPYLLNKPPESSGRVLLATGFAHYCCLHWGYSPTEIVQALEGDGEQSVRDQVAFAAQLLGGVLARDVVKAWTRPIGGGEPARLRDTAWELDDFSRRFLTSGIDPTKPYDIDHPPTHWIFVDLDDWNTILAASVEAEHPFRSRSRQILSETPPALAIGKELAREERLVRLPEVKHRTGLSRSTIYRRMKAGGFPEGIPLAGNMTAWREHDVLEWVEAQIRPRP